LHPINQNKIIMLITTYNNDNDEIRVYKTQESEWDKETPFSVCEKLEKKFKGKGEWIGFAWWRDDINSMSVDKFSSGKGTKSCSNFDEILAKHIEAVKKTKYIEI
jgi:hypothetical protein